MDKIISYATLIGTALGGFIYLQTNFVSAQDFKELQIQQYEDTVYKLVVKEQELKEENKDLKSWEKAELERARQRLRKLDGIRKA